jgi:PAS domain S-box-containing protein
MNKLRILHLEDQPDFSSLVAALLEKEGLKAETVPVMDFGSFNAALEREKFDVILADYSLPTCNGMQALLVARQKCPEVPFLLLSGAIGEHAAVDILQNGAIDYVLKSGLERLVPAIRRAVQETRGRSQLKNAEAEARASERQYHLIFNGSPVPMWVSELQSGVFLEVNEAAIRHYGFTREEFLARRVRDICQPDELAKLAQFLTGKRSPSGIGRAGLSHHRRKDGTLMDVDSTWSIIQFQDREALLTMANRVAESSRPGEESAKPRPRSDVAQRVSWLGSWELELADLENLDRNRLECSDETCRILGFQPGKIPVPSQFFFSPVHPDDVKHVRETLRQAFRTRQPYEIEYRVQLPDGKQRLVRGRAEFVLDGAGKPLQLRGIVMEGIERPRTEAPASAPASAPVARESKPPADPAKVAKPKKAPRPPKR